MRAHYAQPVILQFNLVTAEIVSLSPLAFIPFVVEKSISIDPFRAPSLVSHCIPAHAVRRHVKIYMRKERMCMADCIEVTCGDYAPQFLSLRKMKFQLFRHLSHSPRNPEVCVRACGEDINFLGNTSSSGLICRGMLTAPRICDGAHPFPISTGRGDTANLMSTSGKEKGRYRYLVNFVDLHDIM